MKHHIKWINALGRDLPREYILLTALPFLAPFPDKKRD